MPGDVDLAVALVNNDVLGELLQGKIDAKQAIQSIERLAGEAGISPQDFLALQESFYKADAGSYPELYATRCFRPAPAAASWLFRTFNSGWLRKPSMAKYRKLPGASESIEIDDELNDLLEDVIREADELGDVDSDTEPPRKSSPSTPVNPPSETGSAPSSTPRSPSKKT